MDIFFTLLVLLGVAGETWADRMKSAWDSKGLVLVSVERKRHNVGKFSEAILILGIAGELACLPFSLVESAKLNKEAGEARVIAGEANDRASSNELVRVKLEKQVEEVRSTNLVLSAKVLELERQASEAKIELAKLQLNVSWRQITTEQRKRIISLFGKDPKEGAVEVYFQFTDTEAVRFANQIIEVLTVCKFDVKRVNAFLPVEIPPGLSLFVNNIQTPPARAVEILNVFNDMGLEIFGRFNPDLSGDAVEIWIGTKPVK